MLLFHRHRLEVQRGLHKRGHDGGAPAAALGRHPHPHVRAPAHDPVRLHAQPRQAAVRPGAAIRLLDGE